MFDSRLNLSQQVADEARKFFAERVYKDHDSQKRASQRGAFVWQTDRPLRSAQHWRESYREWRGR